jgi:hypothetical protein
MSRKSVMRTLPKNKLQYEGRLISVKRIQETGGLREDGRWFDTALYRDRGGNFYVAELVQKVPNCLAHWLRESEKQSSGECQLVVAPADEYAILVWYTEIFVNEGPIKEILRKVATNFAWISSRSSKAKRAA